MKLINVRNWIGSELLFSVLTAASPCFARDACTEFNSDFMITGWTDTAPKSIFLYKYEVGGQFPIPTQESPLEYKSTLSQRADGSSILVASPASKSTYGLYIHANYKLVIDSRSEYFISEIKSSNLPRAGCPIDSAKVNQCVTGAGKFIAFSREGLQNPAADW